MCDSVVAILYGNSVYQLQIMLLHVRYDTTRHDTTR